MKNYVKARKRAFTESNIKGGWRGAGLFPLNRMRSTRDIPELEITPPPNNPTTSTFDDLFTQSASLDTTALCKLLKSLADLAIKDEINTSARLAISIIANAVEQMLTENVILKRQLADIEKVLHARQERKASKRGVLKGRNPISTPEILEELKICEENTRSRKKTKESKIGNN